MVGDDWEAPHDCALDFYPVQNVDGHVLCDHVGGKSPLVEAVDNGAGPGDVGAKFAEVGEASEQPRCFLELVGHGLLECQEVL